VECPYDITPCVANHGLGIQVMTNRKLKKKEKSKNFKKELA